MVKLLVVTEKRWAEALGEASDMVRDGKRSGPVFKQLRKAMTEVPVDDMVTWLYRYFHEREKGIETRLFSEVVLAHFDIDIRK